jgi:hypothetical protein
VPPRRGIDRGGALGQAPLHPLPERPFDDAQLRRHAHHPRLEWVHAPQLAPGDRVHRAAAPVPDDLADIGPVAEDPVIPRRPTAQADRPPGPAVRRGHALAVQPPRDRHRRAPGGELRVDSPHDRGLLRHDLAQAPLELAIGPEPAGDPAVAVWRLPEALAGPHPALDAAPGLGGEVLEVEGVHRALQADMQRGHLALGQGHQPHLGEGRELVEGRHVLLVAREAVERLGEHHVDAAAPHGGLECLEAWPAGGGAGEGGVGEGRDHRPALPLGVLAADAELVLDRVLGLAVARVAGVEHGPERGGVEWSGVAVRSSSHGRLSGRGARPRRARQRRS